jgi:mRNA-degrading endonuclease RelE of RelBE toxin-antitoxin system
MQLFYTERFRRSYADAPLRVRKQFDKQAALLEHDIRHPSLRCKKYNEAEDIWQGRVNAGWRFYLRIDADVYYLLDIIPHPK